jgi:hypothetical protein
LSATKAKPSKVTKASAVAGRASAAPKPSKDELRARVEQLERANRTLRGKSREATRAAKVAAERIAELEAQVAQLEKQAARQAAPSQDSQPAVSAKNRRKPQQREIEPEAAVPPDGPVTESADPETKVAHDNLEAHHPEAVSSDANEAPLDRPPRPDEGAHDTGA